MLSISQLLTEKGFLFSPSFDGSYQRDGSKWFRGVEIPMGEKTLLVARFGDWRNDSSYEWKSEEPVTDEDREVLKQALVAFQAMESEEKRKLQEETATTAQIKWSEAIDRGLTPYLTRKKILGLYGTKIDPERTDRLLVPARDISGKLWGYQRILAEKIQVGSEWVDKFFLKGMRIEGCFHLIGELPNDLQSTAPILVAEGFATAASLFIATGYPVCASFNAGNLESVCKALLLRFPHARIVVCGDDDRYTTRVNGSPWNPGREKASKAAGAVGGLAVFPRFSPSDQRLTDWNDLHCSEGVWFVLNQIEAALKGTIAGDEAHSDPGPGGPTENGSGAGGLRTWRQINLNPLPIRRNKNGGIIRPEQQEVVEELLRAFGNTFLKQERDVFAYAGTHWQRLTTGDEDYLKTLIQKICSGHADVRYIDQAHKLFVYHLKSPPEGIDLFIPHPYAANFLNGTLHLIKTSDQAFRTEFRPHRAQDYLINVLNFQYDPGLGAKNDEFLAMLERVFDGDVDKDQKIKAVRQMYGACLMPAFPHLFMLYGPGGTGKSSVLQIAARLVHRDNMSFVAPSDFHSFNMESMAGKLVNMDTDVPIQAPLNDEIVKKIIDRKPLRIRRKGIKDLNAPIPAVHLFGGNDIPRALDGASRAHDRRWTFIGFDKFVPKGSYLQDYWDYCFERSPQGILNFALEGLQDLCEARGHYAVPDSGRAKMDTWQLLSDPVGQFISDIRTDEMPDPHSKVKLSQTRRIVRGELWKIFVAWSEESFGSAPRSGKKTFFEAMRYKKFEEKTIDGVHYFYGIGVEEAPHSHF